jgi:integrase
MKLLLTWFRDTEHIPPEKLRPADIDRPRILRFLDWLQDERGCSPATGNQRLAVTKSFCRYTAVEQPDQLGRVTQVLAIRQKKTPAPQLDHLAGDEVKALLAEPGTASAPRCQGHRPARPGLRHRRPRPGTLRPRRRRHPPRAYQLTQIGIFWATTCQGCECVPHHWEASQRYSRL